MSQVLISSRIQPSRLSYAQVWLLRSNLIFDIDSEYKGALKKLILKVWDGKKEDFFFFIKKEALKWKQKSQVSSVWR